MPDPTSPSVFRTADASTPTEVKAVDKPIMDGGTPVETHIDSLLATYQADQGKPYVAQYLELDGVWDSEPTLKNELNTIEGFLREQVREGKLDNSTKAAKKYLSELEKKAQTNSYEGTTNRLSKILAYIEFRKVVDGTTK